MQSADGVDDPLSFSIPAGSSTPLPFAAKERRASLRTRGVGEKHLRDESSPDEAPRQKRLKASDLTEINRRFTRLIQSAQEAPPGDLRILQKAKDRLFEQDQMGASLLLKEALPLLEAMSSSPQSAKLQTILIKLLAKTTPEGCREMIDVLARFLVKQQGGRKQKSSPSLDKIKWTEEITGTCLKILRHLVEMEIPDKSSLERGGSNPSLSLLLETLSLVGYISKKAVEQFIHCVHTIFSSSTPGKSELINNICHILNNLEEDVVKEFLRALYRTKGTVYGEILNCPKRDKESYRRQAGLIIEANDKVFCDHIQDSESYLKIFHILQAVPSTTHRETFMDALATALVYPPLFSVITPLLQRISDGRTQALILDFLVDLFFNTDETADQQKEVLSLRLQEMLGGGAQGRLLEHKGMASLEVFKEWVDLILDPQASRSGLQRVLSEMSPDEQFKFMRLLIGVLHGVNPQDRGAIETIVQAMHKIKSNDTLSERLKTGCYSLFVASDPTLRLFLMTHQELLLNLLRGFPHDESLGNAIEGLKGIAEYMIRNCVDPETREMFFVQLLTLKEGEAPLERAYLLEFLHHVLSQVEGDTQCVHLKEAVQQIETVKSAYSRDSFGVLDFNALSLAHLYMFSKELSNERLDVFLHLMRKGEWSNDEIVLFLGKGDSKETSDQRLTLLQEVDFCAEKESPEMRFKIMQFLQAVPSTTDRQVFLDVVKQAVSQGDIDRLSALRPLLTHSLDSSLQVQMIEDLQTVWKLPFFSSLISKLSQAPKDVCLEIFAALRESHPKNKKIILYLMGLESQDEQLKLPFPRPTEPAFHLKLKNLFETSHIYLGLHDLAELLLDGEHYRSLGLQDNDVLVLYAKITRNIPLAFLSESDRSTISRVFTSSPDKILALFRQLPRLLTHSRTHDHLKELLSSSEAVLALSVSAFIMNNPQRLGILSETHPLYQEAVYVSTLSDFQSPNNPYTLFLCLRREQAEGEDSSYRAPPVFSTVLEQEKGEKERVTVSLNLAHFQEECKERGKGGFSVKELQEKYPRITQQFADTLFEGFKERMQALQERLQLADQETVSAFEERYGSHYLSILSDLKTCLKDPFPMRQLDLTGTTTSRYMGFTFAILNAVSEASDVVQEGAFLSPKDGMILQLINMVTHCTQGRRFGIKILYNYLPDDKKWKDESSITVATEEAKRALGIEKPSEDQIAPFLHLEEAKQELFELIQEEMFNVLEGDNPLIRDLTGTPFAPLIRDLTTPQGSIDQLPHQALYLKNLLSHVIGLAHPVEFDRYARSIAPELLELSREEVLHDFCAYFTPLLAEKIKGRINDLFQEKVQERMKLIREKVFKEIERKQSDSEELKTLSSKIEKLDKELLALYNRFNASFQVQEGDFLFDHTFIPQGITRTGALHLLQKNGFLLLEKKRSPS